MGAAGRDAALAARRGRRRRRRAGVARRAAVRRPVRGRQRDRLAARRADHHRGPQLAGARVLRPPGRGRPVAGRDDPRPPGAGALLADPRPSAASSASCYRSDQPVFIEPGRDGTDAFSMPRVAVAVRAGDEVLGSIWAAVPRPAQRGAHRGAVRRAKLVALHLLRVRAGADVQRRLRADLVSSALEGGAGAREALDRLGLAGQPLVVLGVARRPSPDDGLDGDRRGRRARAPAAQRRVRDAPRARSTRGRPRRWSAASPTAWCRCAARARTARSAPYASPTTSSTGSATGCAPVVGVGPVARRPGRAGRTPARAPTGRCACCASGRGERRVARLADIQVEALLLELRDLVAARGDRPTGPLARLIAYDAPAPAATWSRPCRPGWTRSAT